MDQIGSLVQGHCLHAWILSLVYFNILGQEEWCAVNFNCMHFKWVANRFRDTRSREICSGITMTQGRSMYKSELLLGPHRTAEEQPIRSDQIYAEQKRTTFLSLTTVEG